MATKKRPISFRLKHQTLLILALLGKKLHVSKTTLIETAVAHYAKEKLKLDNSMMRFAGILSDAEADEMLLGIKKDRRNKKLRVAL